MELEEYYVDTEIDDIISELEQSYNDNGYLDGGTVPKSLQIIRKDQCKYRSPTNYDINIANITSDGIILSSERSDIILFHRTKFSLNGLIENKFIEFRDEKIMLRRPGQINFFPENKIIIFTTRKTAREV